MPRYAAFLRGVMPTNAKMPELRRAFEAAGFTNVVTLLGSGNVIFDARASSNAALEKKAEAAMRKTLGREFMTFVHPIDELKKMLESDPYRGVKVAKDAKRIVTFVREVPPKVKLPIERDGASILRIEDRTVFSAYTRTPKGPVFMALLQQAFGKDQTTRTWQTLEKAAAR
ncbi:MAG TPA: DUF1697 domain-containing protein [Usitatibacter sp.]|nr:DUF1697 domain-containing protein [Usitatibacter sp.]